MELYFAKGKNVSTAFDLRIYTELNKVKPLTVLDYINGLDVVL